MTLEMWAQVLLAVIGVLLTIVGFLVIRVLDAMREEMANTRVEISKLGETIAKILTTLDWHQKWLERHDDEIEILRDNN